MTSLDPSLRALAEAQHGLFTTKQAHRTGLSAVALVHAVRSEELLHPARGLYAVAELVDPTSPSRWHTDLSFGAGLLWDDATLSSTTAVLAHGVQVWGAGLSTVHVLRPIDRSIRVGPYRVRQWTGQPTAPTAVGAAVDLPTALAAHAMEQGVVQGVVSADHALHQGLVSFDDLQAAVEVVGGWRHGSRAVSMLSFANGLRESVGESRCSVILEMAGLVLTPQVEIRDHDGRLVGRVDFLVHGTNVIVEFDGRMKYDSGDPAVLWAEKRREDELRRLGYVVVRITWADLERPGAAAAKVRSAIAAA
ncbi:type IV toxin-antitoxin system AbiEi family antitoxin domain-containing protein [Knoellia sp. LjRoot47]|uniref:type IV toxin-antitoxin system AbiEi family antitoxin domain-containing protein n=1 Tax=Knoellia sp. LjRoot47 TaxID=3342330 RepID=UPI003ED0326B